MYFDSKPCHVCGSDVRLVERTAPAEPEGQVGDPDGFVGEADSTVDDRVCTNPDCPSNRT